MTETLHRPEETWPLEPPRGPHPGPGGAAARLAVALAAFLAVHLVLRAVASPGGGGMVGSKREHFALAAERYDTVFLGSSHVYRSFVPAEFDRVLAEHGVASSSYNFGIQLPNQAELHYLLRETLAAANGRLRRVFVQYQALTPQVDPEQAFIPRNVYWHDLEDTALSIERSWAIDSSAPGGIRLAPDPKRRHAILAILERMLPSRFYLARQHFQHLVKREAMVARAKDVARGLLGRPHGMTGMWGRTRGYLSLEDAGRSLAEEGNERNSILRRREAFLAGHDDWLAHIGRLRTEDVVWGDQEWMNAEVERFSDLEFYRRMVEDARQVGVEIVVVVMPSNSCDRPFEARMETELGVPVLRFDRPDDYPQFYDPELRFDSGHLTAAGAVEFTRVFAKEYLSLSRGG
ncbi:MAG: hypothetical protein AB1726_02820 [Planctomycetota bacterium]